MARTPEEIEAAYKKGIASYDPSADTTKGPVSDWIVQPNSSFLAEIEERQDRTDRLCSGDFAAAATADELEIMAATVGSGIPEGNAATTMQTFGTYSRPQAGKILSIPQGSLVGSLDGVLLYQTTEAAELNGDFPSTYENPARRTYEIRVPVRAVAAGSRYNLPPFRIRKILSTLNGFDFTENRLALDDGLDPGSSADLIVRAQTKFQGQEMGTPGGLEAAVIQAFQEVVLGVSVIRSTDRMLFRRRVNKPGLDLYTVGSSIAEAEFSFTALGGEITVILANKPVTGVIQVLVNDQAVSYEFVPDDDLATLDSLLDTSHILLATALSTGDFVAVRYTHDRVPGLVNASFGGSKSIFETDTLVRRAIAQNPLVTITAKASSNFNPFTLRRNIENVVIGFFETNVLGDVYMASTLEDTLRDKVVGLGNRPIVSLFQLEERALIDVEPIELRRTEYASVDLSKIEISIE